MVQLPPSIPLQLLVVAVLAASRQQSPGDPEGPADPPPPIRVERRSVVMGTTLRVLVDGADRGAALAAAEAALAEVERLDRLLSTWDLESPLSGLNLAPVGEAVHPQPELLALLSEATAWAERTGGVFEPVVGALVDAWELRGAGVRPGAARLAGAIAATGPAAMLVSAQRGTVTRREPAAWIDSGGFGKGAALRSAGALLRARGVGSGLLDLGGQLLALGSDGPAGAPWTVEVAHPTDRRRSVAWLLLHDVSVATSGNSERAVAGAGEPLGHLLDPRSGRPAPVWGSVTVVAADPFVADVLSTALYVMGPEAGATWASQFPDVGVLFLEERDGALLPCWNSAMAGWLVALSGDHSDPGERWGRSCS